MRRVLLPCLAIGLTAALPLAVLLRGDRALAQSVEYVGSANCTDCHDHEDERKWAEQEDGDGKSKQHINALNQLEIKRYPKVKDFIQAEGLKTAYDLKGSCVRCHATVFGGDAQEGVSCETCHGRGSAYLKPHQDKGAYETAVAKFGMKDVWKKPDTWVKECITCHVLDTRDAALIKAGHPTGENFDIGVKFLPVAKHWKASRYSGPAIAAKGNPLRDAILKRVGPTSTAAPATEAATPAPAPVTTTTNAAPPPAPPPTPGGAPPAVPGVGGSPAPPAPPPTGGPVVRPGPSSGTRPATATVPATPRTATLPSTAPPLPLPPAAPPPIAAPTATAPGQPDATPLVAPLPQTPAASVGAIQGGLIALLDALLGRGSVTPRPIAQPPSAATYRGPDAELLRLQEEAIALALEALGTPPRKPAPDPGARP